MNTHNRSIFLIIRYSVITGGVKLGLNMDFESYKEKLFSDSRLSNRLSIFKKITSKSILNQKVCDVNLRVVVLISDELPNNHKKELLQELNFIESNSQFSCDVQEVKKNDSLNTVIKKYISSQLIGAVNHHFATVRLDDDDGLAASYCSELSKYLEKGILGLPISFAYGYEGYFNEVSGIYSNIRHWYYPKIALGLAFTNSYSEGLGFLDDRVSVYALGSHTRIDAKNSVIIDARFPAYFRTVSSYNDSGGYIYHDNLIKVTEGEISFDEFSFINKIEGLPKSNADKVNIIPSVAYSSQSAKFRNAVSALRRKLSENAIDWRDI